MPSLSGPYAKACARLAASGFPAPLAVHPRRQMREREAHEQTEFNIRNVGEAPWLNLTPSCFAASV